MRPSFATFFVLVFWRYRPRRYSQNYYLKGCSVLEPSYWLLKQTPIAGHYFASLDGAVLDI